MTRQIKVRKCNPTNANNELKFILLRLKNCIMETSCWLEGEPILTATRVGVGIIKTVTLFFLFKNDLACLKRFGFLGLS